MDETSETALSAEASAFLRLAVEDGLRIQDQFAAEPVLSRTGRGSMKSAGVDGLLADAKWLQSLKRDGKDEPSS